MPAASRARAFSRISGDGGSVTVTGGAGASSSRSKLMSVLLPPDWWISTAKTFVPALNCDGVMGNSTLPSSTTPDAGVV